MSLSFFSKCHSTHAVKRTTISVKCRQPPVSWALRRCRFNRKESHMAELRKNTIKCAVILFFLFVCGTTARAADFKTGTYSSTAGGVKYSITFHDNKKHTVTRGGEVVVEGSYKVTGDELELTDEKGPIACQGDQKTGKYKWKIEEKKLTLSKVEDGCEGRASALSGQAWVQE